MPKLINCPLCITTDKNILFTNKLFRIIHVHDEFYPGYIRLILNRHVAEMTDIDDKEAHNIFSTLLIIEQCIRDILNPDKINLACLGNVVPHLHWHIIPRYKNDRHFPNTVWGEVVNSKYLVPNYLIDLEQKLVNSIKISPFFVNIKF